MAYAPSSTQRPTSYNANASATTPGVPPGTFAPGTKVQVGNHRVLIERYLSEGGFAHVYVVRVPRSNGQTDSAVLKRVAVPDKETLANMRTEVETMKKLKGHKHIVTYIDSHASMLKDGGYEVFLLMEFCAGGGLIDFMNTRLKNRLTEPEILNIFGDVAEGVACMHYLKPPLLHRDLKVENVLISSTGSKPLYKICDFGSSAPPRPAAQSTTEGRLIEEDVQRHTTLQYRSPEMVDVYRKRPIDEKSDIWALGVLLYKLCYYTTPFEAEGQMAILTASFKYPAYPPFSDRLKKLIAFMLMEEPKRRPNIYQVVSEICAIRGKNVPIKDIYANRTESEARRNQQLPSLEAHSKSPPVVGASHVIPERVIEKIPDVTPMRRGRPGAPSKPADQLVASDPFAALDSKNYTIRAAAVDELSAKYPSVDDFTLLQNSDSKFQFSAKPQDQKAELLKSRVTNALADEAFASLSPPRNEPTPMSKLSSTVAAVASWKESNTDEKFQPQKNQPPQTAQPIPIPSKRPEMVSTGTMTSSPSSPKEPTKYPIISEKPIWRVPSESEKSQRPSTLGILSRSISRSPKPPKRDLSSHRSSLVILDDGPGIAPSRTSSDSERPSHLKGPSSPQRSRSANESARGGESDGQTDVQRSRSRPFHHIRTKSQTLLLNSRAGKSQPQPDSRTDDANIVSDIDYLRAKEQEDSQKSHNRRTSSSLNKIKNATLPSKSNTGSRQLLGGRFGDAFRRFEGHGSSNRASSHEPRNTTDTEYDDGIETPILRSEHVQNSAESPLDETEELSPEMRRELERRALSQEEKRVEEAAAAYRRQVASRDGNPSEGNHILRVNKASAIQDRVKTLLDESGRISPIKRTAEGYGRYTEAETSNDNHESVSRLTKAPNNLRVTSAPVLESLGNSVSPPLQTSVRALPVDAKRSTSARPSAPPKPVALRTERNGLTPDPLKATKSDTITYADVAGDEENWETSFSKRYPRLSLDLVETEIAANQQPQQQQQQQQQHQKPVDLRVKDV